MEFRMEFEVKGPYKIKRFGRKKLITDESTDDLWKSIDDVGLVNGCGCYVFAIRASKGYKPWYVGQASKSKLLKEAMNSRNLVIYNTVLGDNTGTPVIFLLPKLTKKMDRYAAPTSKEDGTLKSVDFLETWLIASALQKNPKLANQKKTHFLKNLHVTGLFNAVHGEATKSSSALKKALFRGNS